MFQYARSMRAASLAAALTTVIAAGAPLTVAQAAAAPASATAQAAQQQIDRIAARFYDARAKYDPLLYATANGDSRYDDQIGMAIDPKVRKRYLAANHGFLKQLQAIDRTRLSDKARLNYDILAAEIQAQLDLERFPEHLLPLNHFDNIPSNLANYASGTGSQPLETPAQHRAYLHRLQQLPAWIAQAIVNMKEGMRTGVVQPKIVTTRMLPQFQQLRSSDPQGSVFYSPARRLPAAFSDKDKRELEAGYRQAAVEIGQALDRLCAFLEKDYLPAGRDTAGYGALPDGAAWYRARIRNNTNLDTPPEQIHATGLKEVARIQAEMAKLAPKLGYDGPLKDFPQWVAAQKKFKPFTSEQQVLERYRQIYAQVDAKLPQYFSLLPNARLDIQLEPELTRATASDHYTPVAADGSHPGVFWAVVNDPNEYDTVGMATLLLHEGVPGHHFHAALLKELPLPDFRKFFTEHPSAAAYTEGWALYCETLGREFGFYEDPAYYYGHLNDELLRAVRLVVDTGMHAQGWSREKAIAYAMENLGYNEAGAANQIERYMVWPGQALAYKTGAMKILELRARAQQALGPKFSYARFHAVVLGDGTLPLPILESQVNRWIEASR
ncbi:DUF885 domain-containing protein [Massilia norwichensis]|uniref:DUF885 domain-containing protein n=1 Tax=Massilia norwichensis TaxID=1442366 RepID=A0ABT2A7Z3_9BURK|nr:DUF885 domain-containing protein [Massilia norwichensis]MCS0590298.1 DUF885 domain-containing protein [Massilia norwichensis]